LQKSLAPRVYAPYTDGLRNYPSTPKNVGPGKYAIDKCPVPAEKNQRSFSFQKSPRETKWVSKK
jgi:hypothetical protein